jgi:curved DNA-binding protein CbpA
MNPYLVLRVPKDADDAHIRRAYLDAVRASPPEANPVRFKEVAAAYEKIKDAPSRCRHEAFDTQCPGESPLDAFLQHVRAAPPPPPLPFEAMKELLRSCAKS